MAGARLSRCLDSGAIAAGDVEVVNRHGLDLPGIVRQARTLPDGPPPDMVMLGMKPQQIDEVVAAYGDRIVQAPVLVSLLAGVEEATLAERFPGAALVRALPTLPVALGTGVVALPARAAPEAVKGAVAARVGPR